MRFKSFLLFSLILISIGCATRSIPKTQLLDHMENNDWDAYLGSYFENMLEDQRWNICFDITDEEFKKEIIEIYSDCRNDFMDRKYKTLPDKLTRSELSKLTKSIDQCAKIKFIVKNRDNFILDKHTEKFDQCLKMYDQLIRKMK